MSDPRYWAWWQDRLAGKDVPASEGTPYAGFYRWVRKTGYGGKKFAIPVAYWPGEAGELHCRVGTKDVTPQHGMDIWVNVHDNPVAEDWYREVAEQGSLEWRDGMPTVAPMGDNMPPSETDYEYLKERIEQLGPEGEAIVAGPPITEQVQADRISNKADEIAELHKKAMTARDTERAPHDKAVKEIVAKWAPLIGAAEVYKNIKYKIITPWQVAQERAQQEAAKAAEAAGEPAPEESRPRPRAGTRGRAMTLRTYKVAEITDFEVCLTHFKGHDAVRAVIQDLANKAVRVGLEVPGAKLVEEKRTV